MSLNIKDYPEIEKIYNDIKNLNVQGATNVAIATFEGMKLYEDISKQKEKELFYKEFFELGDLLSHARANEPMAINGVKYVKYSFNKKFPVLPDIQTMKPELATLCDQFLDFPDLKHSQSDNLKKISLKNLGGFFQTIIKFLPIVIPLQLFL
jgi:translation initiation factor 2B subunit (eIF-2B alpha/beta/delta family)